MKIIKEKNNTLTFAAEISDSLANAIRRHIHRIPVLAIDEVEISKNDSPLYDETISHRLGLVPLRNEKNIGGDSEAKLKIETSEEGVIYSGKLKGSVKPVFDKIPLTVLSKDQELELNAVARVGRGYQHSKFSPGLMTYRNIFEVSIDKNAPQEILKECPSDLVGTGKTMVYDEEKIEVLESCADACKKKGKEYITLFPSNELLITIESFGQLESREIFKKSIEELKKGLAQVEKNIARA
ncbi:DNA-directed RNA polymerase subunit D [Candidatus Pacearchaeota archaeon]|nr:DNA-directed RNA polymerase subunit D [Candidatus Pacearchaeota archaeon]